MKPNRAKRLILLTFVAVMLTAGAGLTAANAQDKTVCRPQRVIVYRPYYRYYRPFYDPFYDPFWGPSWPSYRMVDPIAYQREQGYSDGRSKGKEDAKKGRPANPTGQKNYLKSNSLTYREAFVAGYNDRYREKIKEMRAGGD